MVESILRNGIKEHSQRFTKISMTGGKRDYLLAHGWVCTGSTFRGRKPATSDPHGETLPLSFGYNSFGPVLI